MPTPCDVFNLSVRSAEQQPTNHTLDQLNRSFLTQHKREPIQPQVCGYVPILDWVFLNSSGSKKPIKCL